MKITNYAEMLPNNECDPRDAIEAIGEKLPTYIRKGLFEVNDFLSIFADRIHHIVDNLPENPDDRKSAEIELAYMIHELYSEQDIVIARDLQQANLRRIELALENAGVLNDYLKFSQEEGDDIDISDPELFVDFLDYLSSYMWVGIKDVIIYLQTCVSISQQEGGADILMTHLGRRFAQIPRNIIDNLIEENNGYMRRKNGNMDTEIRHIMETEELDYWDASLAFGDFQTDCAGLHFFLTGLYSEYVGPKLTKDAQEEKYVICTMLDDLRDIADPHYYVPLVFQNGNIPTLLERQKMVEDGREIH